MIKQPHIKDMILCDDAQFCRENKIGVSIIYAYEDSDNFINNPSFLIRAKSVSSKMMSIASNELGVEVLKSEISYLKTF